MWLLLGIFIAIVVVVGTLYIFFGPKCPKCGTPLTEAYCPAYGEEMKYPYCPCCNDTIFGIIEKMKNEEQK
jgi:hypothetical protein